MSDTSWFGRTANAFNRRFPALLEPKFRRYLAVLLISVIGTWMQSAALGWYVQTLTKDIGSEYWLGVVAAVQALPVLLLTAVGGYVADHFPRRGVVIVSQATAAAAAFLMGAGILLGFGSIPFVLCVACATGAAMAFDIPARQAYLSQLVGRESFTSAMGLSSTAFNVGRLVGPAAAGGIALSLGIAACFLINAFSFLPSIAFFIKQRRHTPTNSASKGWTAGYLELAKKPGVMGLLLTNAAVQIFGGSYITLAPALADNVLGVKEAGYSLLLGANGAGALVGSIWVASLVGLAPRRNAGVGGTATMAAGLFLMAYSSELWLASFAMMVAGAGFVVFLTSTNSTLQLMAPDHLRGRVASLWVFTFAASQPIGNLIAGCTAHWGGAPGVLERGAVGLLGCTWMLIWLHRTDRRASQSDSGEEAATKLIQSP